MKETEGHTKKERPPCQLTCDGPLQAARLHVLDQLEALFEEGRSGHNPQPAALPAIMR